jgi:hypothetical protein
MAWMEMIKIRTPGGAWRSRAAARIRAALGSLGESSDPRWGVYEHASLPYDLGLTLTWQGLPPRPGGSDMATRLIRELGPDGLVDHSVWVQAWEMDPLVQG